MILTRGRLEQRLARGRQAWLIRAPSLASVYRKTNQTRIHPVSGLKVPVWDLVAEDLPFQYDGPDGGASRTVTIGDTSYEAATGVGKLPHDFADLADRDLIQITAGEWAGTVLRVIEATRQQQKTSRRFPVEAVAAPAEWEETP